MIRRAGLQVGRRYRQLHNLWKCEGSRGIADRARTTAAQWLAPKNVIMPVRRVDVLAADLARPFQPVIPNPMSGEPITLNWVTTPSGPGSGGHTTLFRIIGYLESHGYVNRVYFYDVYGGDHDYYESVVRGYYDFHGTVGRVDDGMEDAHAVVATAWPTAYPVFNSRCAGKRFYFVQDFEPYFYPVGSISFLAESTYRMGFQAITIGQCFAQKLAAEFGMAVESFEYGCDISRYYPRKAGKRSGVVFYAKPEAARRGFELGIMALEVFAAKRPDVEIHIYGEKVGRLPFRCIDHGRKSPEDLNYIYNRCYAGLSLSLTNVSLVTNEMLASGCIPVVNDSDLIRTDLQSPFVRYVQPYPHTLAAELESVVTAPDFDSLSRQASASVQSSSWDAAGARVDEIFRQALKSAETVAAYPAKAVDQCDCV